MLNNYNLFNNEKVDDLTSIFLEKKNYNPEIIEIFILELLNYYDLKDLCIDISFLCDNSYYLGMYNNEHKKLFINYKRIIDFFNKISIDDYFIKSNIYRIVLHEMKHILQHKMIKNRDNQLYKLFQTEFNNSFNSTLPSEVNADIESLLVIVKNYNKKHNLYEKQLTFSINLINSFYKPKCVVGNYCLENKIQIPNIDLVNKFIYGIDDELIKQKKY